MTGWLNKNRDPINDTVVDLLKKSKTCTLMCEIYMDHPGQTKEEEDLPPPRPQERQEEGGGEVQDRRQDG